MRSPEPLLTTTEGAASAIGVGKTKLFELIAAQEIETVLLGRRRMVVISSLAGFVNRLRERARAEAV